MTQSPAASNIGQCKNIPMVNATAKKRVDLMKGCHLSCCIVFFMGLIPQNSVIGLSLSRERWRGRGPYMWAERVNPGKPRKQSNCLEIHSHATAKFALLNWYTMIIWRTSPLLL